MHRVYDARDINLQFEVLDIYVRGTVIPGQWFASSLNHPTAAELVFSDAKAIYPAGDYNIWFGRDFHESPTTTGGEVCVDVYAKEASADDALLAYYSFDDFSAKDDSGHGRLGTIAGNIVFIDDGKNGAAAQFDGTGKIMLDASLKELQWGTFFSTSFWFRRMGGREFEDQGLFFAGNCWKIASSDANTVSAGVNTEASPDRDDVTSFVTMYQWQHIAFVYDGQKGEAILYVTSSIFPSFRISSLFTCGADCCLHFMVGMQTASRLKLAKI